MIKELNYKAIKNVHINCKGVQAVRLTARAFNLGTSRVFSSFGEFSILENSNRVTMLFCVLVFCFNAEGSLRKESELKLDIPPETYKKVWNYFELIFKNNSKYIQSLKGNVETSFSTEKFVDEYFDNSNADFYRNEHGLRYRQRFFPDEPHHPKNGRRLIQVKLSSQNKESIVRSEVKYDAMEPLVQDSFLNQHELFSHLFPTDQQSLMKFLKGIGYEPLDFRSVINLTQMRRRVYFKKDKMPFLTLTLDEVEVMKRGKKKKFYEMEIEVDENLYTGSTVEQRKSLEEIASKIKSDLLVKFSDIKQDQTPKYNKAFLLFEKENLKTPGSKKGLIILIATIFVIAFRKRLGLFLHK